MRAWEFLEHRQPRSSPITIRHLHTLKNEEKRRHAADQERKALIPIIYGNSDWEREQLELRRLKLELEQLEAEIAATTAETESKTRDKITDMARSGIKAENKTEQNITAMARRDLGRRKKCSTVS